MRPCRLPPHLLAAGIPILRAASAHTHTTRWLPPHLLAAGIPILRAASAHTHTTRWLPPYLLAAGIPILRAASAHTHTTRWLPPYLLAAGIPILRAASAFTHKPRRPATHLLVAAAILCQASACTPNPSAPLNEVASAQFGLFFGGQVQQRLELPKPLNQNQSGQGLRLEFRRRLPTPTQVTWHLDLPTARTGPRGPCNAARAIRTSSVVVPAGSDRFEQAIPLEAADPPGTYNLRVLVGDELALDRSFRVVPARLEDGE